MSIWSDRLAEGREVPALALGHTLVLSHPEANRQREVVHVVPEPGNLAEDRVRLRRALKVLGLRADHGGTNDTGLQSLWTGGTTEDLVAVAVPECLGSVQVEMAPGFAVVTFKPTSIREPSRWLVLAAIHDPDLDPLTGRWATVDRDRWLAWAGFEPAWKATAADRQTPS